jgi:tetratricopeptide (TPR) repeat protein
VINDRYPNEAQVPVIAAVHQLPAPSEDFTGRERELEKLRASILSGGATISSCTGQGGVGKTALALKLADEIEALFPDAQIYLNLQGLSEKPLTPSEAMACVLRAFEPDVKLPRQEQKLVAIYRSVLEGKRALLLMDDARNMEQVEPLVPPMSCCFLVTSHVRFALPGLHAVDLDALVPAEAQELLLKIEPRIGAEAPGIADLCGYIPQALCLAAAALAERVDISPSDYRGRLADERNQPKLLGDGNESAEAAISLSYSLLDPDTQKRWRMLCIFQESFDETAAAAVWKAEETSTEDTLDLLTQYSMLEWNDNAHRYRLPDLMRDFACQRVRADEWNEAALCHAQHYLGVLRSADDLYLDGGESLMRGLALFDLERGNIEAGQSWAAVHAFGDREAAVLSNSYPTAGAHCVSLRQHPRERIRWREDALGAAIRLQDRGAERAHLGNLGSAYMNLGEYRRAIECYEKHLQIARELDDRRGEGQDLANLGNAYDFLGEHPRAIEFYEQQLQIARDLDDRRREGNALSSLGTAYHSMGEYGSAIKYHEQALISHRDIGDRRGEGIALGNLGIAHYRLGEHQRAIAFYAEQLQIARGTSDRHGEGNALWNMSLALDELGERRKAIEHAEAALKVREEIKDPNAAKVRRQLEEWQKQ